MVETEETAEDHEGWNSSGLHALTGFTSALRLTYSIIPALTLLFLLLFRQLTLCDIPSACRSSWFLSIRFGISQLHSFIELALNVIFITFLLFIPPF